MKTTTSIKLDTEVKRKAAKLAKQLGLSLSCVINTSLKTFVNERRVVFSVTPEFNEKTKKKMSELHRDAINGKNIVGPFEDVDSLKKSLLS